MSVTRASLGLIGLAVLAAGLMTSSVLDSATRAARSRDRQAHYLVRMPDSSATRECSGTHLADVFVSRRVISEHETVTLTAALRRDRSVESCETTVSLRAGGFEPAGDTRQVRFSRGQTEVSTAWVLGARQAGSQEVAVETAGTVQIRAITVKTVLGLSAGLAAILSKVAWALGPMLTLPWWVERWDRRRKRSLGA